MSNESATAEDIPYLGKQTQRFWRNENGWHHFFGNWHHTAERFAVCSPKERVHISFLIIRETLMKIDMRHLCYTHSITYKIHTRYLVVSPAFFDVISTNFNSDRVKSPRGSCSSVMGIWYKLIKKFECRKQISSRCFTMHFELNASLYNIVACCRI